MTKRIGLPVLFLIVALGGCSTPDEPIEPAPPAPPRPAFAPSIEKSVEGWSVVKFNGHTYVERLDVAQVGVWSTDSNAGPIMSRSVAIAHDPDCAKCARPTERR